MLIAKNTSINSKQCRKLKLNAKKVEIKLIDRKVAKAQQNKMAVSSKQGDDI